MIKQAFLISSPLLLTLLLSSCSTNPAATKRAYCNMLKNNLMFNGQTSIIRAANIENSNTPLDQRSYEADCEN